MMHNNLLSTVGEVCVNDQPCPHSLSKCCHYIFWPNSSACLVKKNWGTMKWSLGISFASTVLPFSQQYTGQILLLSHYSYSHFLLKKNEDKCKCSTLKIFSNFVHFYLFILETWLKLSWFSAVLSEDCSIKN